MTIFKYIDTDCDTNYVNLNRIDLFAVNGVTLTMYFGDGRQSEVCPEDSVRLRKWLDHQAENALGDFE